MFEMKFIIYLHLSVYELTWKNEEGEKKLENKSQFWISIFGGLNDRFP